MIVLVMIWGGEVAAESLNITNGYRILKICESKRQLDSGICTGYLAGVLNGVQATQHILKINPVFCKPKNVRMGMLQKLIIKHLHDNPNLLHKHSSFLVIQAVRLAYPCNRNIPNEIY